VHAVVCAPSCLTVALRSLPVAPFPSPLPLALCYSSVPNFIIINTTCNSNNKYNRSS
jgi:hypothetical protein